MENLGSDPGSSEFDPVSTVSEVMYQELATEASRDCKEAADYDWNGLRGFDENYGVRHLMPNVFVPRLAVGESSATKG